MTNAIPIPIPDPKSLTPSARQRANRANALHSTGPKTDAGKQRSSLNALRHGPQTDRSRWDVPENRVTRAEKRSAGLSAASAVLPTEDRTAYEDHRPRFLDEYQPAAPTETQLVQELADTSWRLNRIPFLEAELLSRAAHPPSEQAAIDFDIVDAHRLLANLGIQGQRLSRQFQRSLDTLREIQAGRTERERRDLQNATALLDLHKHKGVPWQPADHGFVFSRDQVERFAQRLRLLNQSRHIEHVLFHGGADPWSAPSRPEETGLGSYFTSITGLRR